MLLANNFLELRRFFILYYNLYSMELKDESIKKAINLDNELDIKLQNDSKAEVKDLAEDLIDIEASETGETND